MMKHKELEKNVKKTRLGLEEYFQLNGVHPTVAVIGMIDLLCQMYELGCKDSSDPAEDIITLIKTRYKGRNKK